MKAVILCGGSGTRLWPISRTSTPKQFARLFENKSLFDLTLERNKKFVDGIIVIVNEKQLSLCQEQIPTELKDKVQFIIEPSARNTAPAICLAALAANKNEDLLVLPSDHLIQDLDIYEDCLKQASTFSQEKNLVTFGMEAKYPETGFGYIEALGNDVKSFKEKPDLETAKSYAAAGNFYWNSGMFMFTAETFLEDMKAYSPKILEKSQSAFQNAKIENNIIRIQKDDMDAIPANSIDYAVMESSERVKVIPSKFYWSDLGSFDALYDILPKDSHGNTKDAAINLDSKNNLILKHKKLIATFDIEDLIIVDTEDALLIAKRGNSQRVKNLLELVSHERASLLD